MLNLHKPVVSICDKHIRATSRIVGDKSARDLWFEVNTAEILPTHTMDAFVIGCLLPAMMSGEDIYVKGTMSSKLFYNVTHYLIPILTQFFPSSHTVAVRATSLSASSGPKARGVLAAFSGGIDSFCNYYDHCGNRAPAEYLITHLIFNNVGSHGQRSPDVDRAIFVQRAVALERFASQESKAFITVDSNLDEIIGMDFQLTHTIRNAAVALLMQNIVSKFYYASTYSFSNTHVKPSYDIAHLDPVLLPLLGTERIECIASGGQYSRVGKTRCVVEMEASAQLLDVCVDPFQAAEGRPNCSRCWKCLRTELTLSVLGKLDRYEKVFDVASFQQVEYAYLLEALKSSDPLLQDIETLINSTNFRIPRLVYVLAAIIPETLRRWLSRKLISKLFFRPRGSRLMNACLSSIG